MHISKRLSALCGSLLILVGCGTQQAPTVSTPDSPDAMVDAGTPEAAVDRSSESDPCAPNGHLHQDPTGVWCHCDKGYETATMGLACVPSKTPAPTTPFDFPDPEHACWHTQYGPFATVALMGEAGVNRFHTLYTVELNQTGEGKFARDVFFKAWANDIFIVYLDTDATLEVTEEGRAVPQLKSAEVAGCAGLKRQIAFEMTKNVRYTLAFSEHPSSSLRVLVEESE